MVLTVRVIFILPLSAVVRQCSGHNLGQPTPGLLFLPPNLLIERGKQETMARSHKKMSGPQLLGKLSRK